MPYNSSLGITSNKYSFRIKEQNFKQENLINVSICKIYTAQRLSDLYPRNQHPLLWQGKNSCIATYIHTPSLHQTTLLLHLNIFISNWIDYNNSTPPNRRKFFIYIKKKKVEASIHPSIRKHLNRKNKLKLHV